ncbi:hypothetical protein [Nannocystis sp. SCPEA4]|uniref:hypothetical protein n=1 Tax=Nannocystis sp. SCPEA4 TaxID=2996787 RepID=UPI00226F922C|nr:hypothetical protein [Nannocystis sp. SCPEA4]MCY1059515.1 hypothetical protein [Nannocystis sp. SCPEA4]
MVLSLFALGACKSPGGGDASATEVTGNATTTGTGTGTGTATDTPTGTGAPAFDPQEAAEQICGAVLACECAEPKYADQATCVTETLAAFTEAESVAAENGLVFDSSCIDTLAASYPTLGCAIPSPEVHCSWCATVSGMRQVGEECTSYDFGSDCAQGLVCSYSGRCIGRCGSTAQGEYCNFDRECADGLACAKDETCAPRVGAGESCANARCAEGLLCANGDICVPPTGNGESCAAICCGEGLYCRNDVCTPQLAEGASCKIQGVTTCADTCSEGLQCDTSGSGKCVPFQQPGDSCDHFGLECGPGVNCEDDVCVEFVYFCDRFTVHPWLEL